VAGDAKLVGFYTPYKAVFDAVKAAIETKSSIKSVLLGEQFTYGQLPKAMINALPSPISQETLGELLEVKVKSAWLTSLRIGMSSKITLE
jgi:hypothetical protein